jgi:hypothetical protein
VKKKKTQLFEHQFDVVNPNEKEELRIIVVVDGTSTWSGGVRKWSLYMSRFISEVAV